MDNKKIYSLSKKERFQLIKTNEPEDNINFFDLRKYILNFSENNFFKNKSNENIGNYASVKIYC